MSSSQGPGSTLQGVTSRVGVGVGDCLADRYDLVSVLGRGGFGTVFEAIDKQLQRDVAVKVLKDPSPEDCERFLREARIVAALESDYIVRLFETGVDPSGAPFLVMERLRGSALSEHVRANGGTLVPREAVDLVIEACAGLSEAHARGIVHRDLKPQNLFLTERRDGSRILKVLDFGIAKWSAGSATLTTNQVAMGTLHYMAPEQIRDAKNADARADVWALGVVLYELVTGRPLFEAESDAAFGALVLVADPEPVTALNPSVDPALAAVIHRCLCRAREARISSVAELSNALAPFASHSGNRLALSIQAASSGPSVVEGGASTQHGAPPTPEALAETELATRLDPPRSVRNDATQKDASTPRRRASRALALVAATACGVTAVGYAAISMSKGPGPALVSATTGPTPGFAPTPKVSATASEQTVPLGSAPPTAAPAAESATANAGGRPMPAPATAPATTATSAATRAERERVRSRKFFEACVSVPGLIPIHLVGMGGNPHGQCSALRNATCEAIQAQCRNAFGAEAFASCNSFVAVVRGGGGC